VAEGADDEQSFWREYLLYHRIEGFAFLVDAEDGWSWTAPLTGVPQAVGQNVKYLGVLYRKLYSYTGELTYVLGEFYWQLTRRQRTANTDYVGTGLAHKKRLNREQTGSGQGDETAQEIVWSAGEALDADTVRRAFKLPSDQAAGLQRDATPTAFSARSLLAKVFFWVFFAVVVLLMFKCDGSDADCDSLRSTYGEAWQEYRNCLSSNRSGGRTSGGSFGGFSSGGSHK